jgi:hypothetical protein
VHVIPAGSPVQVIAPSDLVSPQPSAGQAPDPDPSAEYVHVT